MLPVSFEISAFSENLVLVPNIDDTPARGLYPLTHPSPSSRFNWSRSGFLLLSDLYVDAQAFELLNVRLTFPSRHRHQTPFLVEGDLRALELVAVVNKQTNKAVMILLA